MPWAVLRACERSSGGPPVAARLLRSRDAALGGIVSASRVYLRLVCGFLLLGDQSPQGGVSLDPHFESDTDSDQ